MPKPEILNVDPIEAITHFRLKGYHVGFDWRDTQADHHLRSFTVAKMMDMDMLVDIRSAIDSALAMGTTFSAFQDEIEPMLRARGWWGKKMVIDPVTGDQVLAQLGSSRRLRTIFDTNLRTARAHGLWQQIERLAADRPYLRYVGIMDSNIRPEHAAWHGTILRWDDSWWRSHFPPNGWRCRCTVRQLSDDDLDDYKFEVSERPPSNHRTWLNKRTGEIETVPAGIDPGWDHNVGLFDLGLQLQKITQQKANYASPAIKQQVQKSLDGMIGAGRGIRHEILQKSGKPDAPDFSNKFRNELTQKLQAERGAGTILPKIENGGNGRNTIKRVRAEAQKLPASWIEKGNQGRLLAFRGQRRGGYSRRTPPPSEIRISQQPGSALHEYAHHLQFMMPGLDLLFQQLHHRRTSRENQVQVGGPAEMGRKDQYLLPYQGREYTSRELPYEVFTMAIEQLFHPVFDGDYLRLMVADDPEILDLILGALFHYDE